MQPDRPVRPGAIGSTCSQAILSFHARFRWFNCLTDKDVSCYWITNTKRTYCACCCFRIIYVGLVSIHSPHSFFQGPPSQLSCAASSWQDLPTLKLEPQQSQYRPSSLLILGPTSRIPVPLFLLKESIAGKCCGSGFSVVSLVQYLQIS